MKSFVYTAKDVSGALKRGGLQAVDRTDALDSLKTKGWTPISLMEGHVPREEKKWLMPLVLMMLSVVLGYAVFMIVRTSPQPKETPKATTNVAQRMQEGVSAQGAKETTQPEPALADSEKEAPLDQVDVLSLPVQPNPPIKPLAQAVRPVRVLTPGGGTNLPPRQAFSTGTERLISWMANTRLGDPVPPLPMLPIGEDIEKILDTDIAVYDDDDEKTVQAKVNVAKMKQSMKAFIKEGGDPQDFLTFYREELDMVHKERVEEQKELMRLYREGGGEQARAFADTRNKELGARGIRPLALPPFLRE